MARFDIRLPQEPSPIEGIDPRVDELLNERFRRVEEGYQKLLSLVVEPRFLPPARAYDGQLLLTDISGEPTLYYYWDGEWIEIADRQPTKAFMEWYGQWSPTTFPKGAVVWDDGWLMVANKPTTDRAAPQKTGNPIWDLPDTPGWDADAQHLGVVYSGHKYTFNQPGYLNSVDVWVPELTPDLNYRIIIIDSTDPAAPKTWVIEGPVLNLGAWTTVAVNPTPLGAGTVVSVILDALNSGGSTQVTGGWTRGVDDNNNPPAAQAWNKNTQSTLLRIDHTDLDSTDRQSELEGIIPGSTIQFVDTDNPNRSITYHVDAMTPQAGYVEYAITPAGEGISGPPPVGGTTTMTADVPVPQSTKYKVDSNYWSGNQPSFATVEGVLQLSGVEQSVPLNAYGVRINFQPATVSEDWDVLSYTEISGAGLNQIQAISAFSPGFTGGFG